MSSVWVLSDERIGNRKQVLALADAVRSRCGVDYTEKLITAKGLWARMPNRLTPPFVFACDTSDLQPPYPQMILSCGRIAARAALALKQADKHIRLVQILNPQAYHKAFDCLILPRHDNYRSDNVLTIDGALTDVTPQSVEKEGRAFAARYENKGKTIGVLIGGSNKAYRLDAETADHIVALLQAWEAEGYHVIGSFSRRTPVDLQERLLSMAQASATIDFWNGEGANPYFGILAHAQALAVTCDSINMVSEAYHSRKPTYVIGLAEKRGGNHKFARFLATQMKAERIRQASDRLDFNWQPAPCNDLVRATDAVANLLR